MLSNAGRRAGNGSCCGGMQCPANAYIRAFASRRVGNLKKPWSELARAHTGARCGNSMTSLAKDGGAGGASPGPVGSAAESTAADDASRYVREEDEPEGDRLSERVEKLLMDIKTGKVRTTTYTLDEHMRYLDKIRNG